MKSSTLAVIVGTSGILLAPPAPANDVASKRGNVPASFSAKKLSGETLFFVPEKPKAKPAPAPAPAPKANVAPAPKPEVKPKPTPAPKVVQQSPPAKQEKKQVQPEAKVNSRGIAKPTPPSTPAATEPKTEEPKKFLGLFGGKKEKAKEKDKEKPSAPEKVTPPVVAKPQIATKPQVIAKPAAPETKKEEKPVAKLPTPPAPTKVAAKADVKPSEKKESSGFRFFSFRKKDPEPTAKVEVKAEKKTEPKVADKPSPAKPPVSTATADAAAKKKAPPPLIAAPEEKKPGLFSRIFGKRNKDNSESDLPGDDRPVRPADWESKYIITDNDVKGYANGPSQSMDADERLAKGTVVSLKKGGKAWADIKLEDGRTLTVGADQIRPAKISDFATPSVALATTRSTLPEIYYEPAPPPNLPETSGPSSLELPELLLPPLPPQ